MTWKGESKDDKERVEEDGKVEQVPKVEKDEGKRVQGCWSDEVDGEGQQKVLIIVKVDVARTSMMEMAMGDKVNDIVKRIPISNQDVYVTSGGRVLRGSDRLRSCGVTDGCTIQVTSRMR